MKTPSTPITESEAIATNVAVAKAPQPEATAPSEAWQEFLEDDADCCGGCNHKPR
ncbi:MAG: hypothetical protein K2X09_01695 [Rickettsiales bacterium]|nr:hypothetical protein [Rickettsiales bacterium]